MNNVVFTMEQIEMLKELIGEAGTMDAIEFIDKVIEAQA